MNMKSIEDVFIHLLSDTYSAEKQLTRGLAKLARAASSEKLSAAFNAHLEETQGQIERIDQIIEQESGLKIKRIRSSITKLPVTAPWSPWQNSWAIKKRSNCWPKRWKKKSKPTLN